MKLKIEIDDENLCTLEYNDHDAVLKKTTTFDELIKTISLFSVKKNMRNIKQNMSEITKEYSSIYPGDKIISTVQEIRMNDENNSVWYILMREPSKIDFKYRKRGTEEIKVYKKVGIPRILMAVKVANNRCANAKLMCLKNNDYRITEDTQLYAWPYSNVFGSGICWGSNTINNFELNSLNNLSFVPEMFLQMVNNDDGYIGSNLSGLNYETLLEKMSNKKFDDKILKSGEITYKNFIKSLK